MKHRGFLILFLLLAVYSSSAQTTRNVPEDYTTIQSALNAANPGDTVKVQAATYYEQIIWPNKNGIILAGASKENTYLQINRW